MRRPRTPSEILAAETGRSVPTAYRTSPEGAASPWLSEGLVDDHVEKENVEPSPANSQQDSSKSTSWSDSSQSLLRASFTAGTADPPPGINRFGNLTKSRADEHGWDLVDEVGIYDVGASSSLDHSSSTAVMRPGAVYPKAVSVDAYTQGKKQKNAAQKPREGEVWSVGSELHATGNCKPCIWMKHNAGCTKGAECIFCHVDHPKGRRTRPSKEYRTQCKEIVAKLDQEFGHDPESFMLAAAKLEGGDMSKYMKHIIKGHLECRQEGFQQDCSQHLPYSSGKASGKASPPPLPPPPHPGGSASSTKKSL
eukprot:gnl/TRDRNA2_/TRDRNA2_172218_c0_seq3.p1 gnl/TRDRNA2_/TRDRNA2_172218_c0~~gnl/TRDRNA2_/TRDRNA2_172218_c0_seq3.p1  ORF type:complete len:309 (+),score=22.09 gnl/TRDRNA2_/TRDRNA2_172218_c0_seq3:80-1006(+)